MRPTAEHGARSERPQRPETVILFFVGRQIFAIAADSVQEIRSTDSLAGAAIEINRPELPKVRHTIERSRRAYYVVNAAVHFNLPVTRPALVLILRNLRAAVLVDRIERMAEISAVYSLPQAFAGEERRWYRGLAYLDDVVIPVINPGGFLAQEDFQRLDRAASAAASQREMEGAVRP